MKRRTFIKSSIAASATVGTGLLASNMAFAASHSEAPAKAEDAKDAAADAAKDGAADPYKATSIEDALKAMDITAEDSDKVTVQAPDLAENAAVVPVEATTTIEGAEEIILMVSNNPTVLVAKFKLGEGAEPSVKCRFKVGKTGDVVAVVKAGDKYYTGKKAVKVTKGGCGG